MRYVQFYFYELSCYTEYNMRPIGDAILIHQADSTNEEIAEYYLSIDADRDAIFFENSENEVSHMMVFDIGEKVLEFIELELVHDPTIQLNY